MKKALLILLSVFYLVMSSGFTTITHFCKGVKQETSLFSGAHTGKICPKCAAKNLPKNKNCCKHKTQLNQITEKAHQKVVKDIAFKTLDLPVPVSIHETILGLLLPKVNKPHYFFSAFIPLKSNPLYIFYCVYRI